MYTKSCKVCHKQFQSKIKNAGICSLDCRKFYDNTVPRIKPEMLADALVITDEEDYKEFIREYFYMKNGKLNYQLLSSPLLASYLNMDPLKFANSHNKEQSVNERVLVWLYDLQPGKCRMCGRKTSLDIKNSIPAYRQYCSESCYAQSMKRGGEGRKSLDHSIKRKYGVRNVFLIPSILKVAKENNVKTCMEKYGVPHVLCNPDMYKHITKDLNNQSKAEREICEWLESVGVKHTTSDYSLMKGYEFEDGGTRRQIDIYCPDHKLAIEFNGLYWHSEIHKYRRYHLEKTEACEAQGVQLIHIWEDEWHNNPEIVKGLLAAKLGIKKPSGYARQCYVEEGKKSDILELLASQHIQGTIHSATHYLLLRDKRDNQVRAVMTFIKRVVKGEQCMELTRFASDGIHGAFSKLLAYYKEHLWDGVKTFSFGDRCVVSRLSNIYLSHGFAEEEIQDPDYKYHKPGTLMREHKFGFRKADFAQMGYDVEGKTEDQLATEAGLVRIWNCGLIKYVLN